MGYYADKAVEYIKNPVKIKLFMLNHGLGRLLPDKTYLNAMFKIRVGRSINWDNPKSFNEKLQWLKIHEHFPERTLMVDKYEVRDYIRQKIGEEYLIPLLGVWDTFDQIDFDSLPERFVLKCTHDSGGVVICKDRKTFKKKEAETFFSIHLKRNYFKSGREFPYKNVKPRIIAEAYMEDDSGVELKDYKLMCFNGKVRCSFVCSNRNLSSGLCVNFYDENWKPMPFERHYPRNPVEIARPVQYDRMVELAEQLAENMKFVRVDFYEIHGRIYFGELTFYPGSGMEEFTPEKYDYLLGSWIQL